MEDNIKMMIKNTLKEQLKNMETDEIKEILDIINEIIKERGEEYDTSRI